LQSLNEAFPAKILVIDSDGKALSKHLIREQIIDASCNVIVEVEMLEILCR
jgi:hypothetical protein